MSKYGESIVGEIFAVLASTCARVVICSCAKFASVIIDSYKPQGGHGHSDQIIFVSFVFGFRTGGVREARCTPGTINRGELPPGFGGVRAPRSITAVHRRCVVPLRPLGARCNR